MDKMSEALLELIRQGIPLAQYGLLIYFAVKAVSIAANVLVIWWGIRLGYYICKLIARSVLLNKFIQEGNAECDKEARNMVKGYIEDILYKE